MFGKRGQVTVFIVIAILIVGAVAVFFFVSPSFRSSVGLGAKSPEQFLQTCLEDPASEVVEKVALQGGSFSPLNYQTYDSIDIAYLCYSADYWELCSVQVPFLKPHIESEIKSNIQQEVSSCLESMEKSFKDGSLTEKDFSVTLLPGRVLVSSESEFSFGDSDSRQRISEFRVVLNNNLYELLGISDNIIEDEARAGDSDNLLYTFLYEDLKVEKEPLVDGTSIYIITDKRTDDKFQFASRSLAPLS